MMANTTIAEWRERALAAEAQNERLQEAIRKHREAWRGAGAHWQMNEELWATIGLRPPGEGGWVCPHDWSAMDMEDEKCLLCDRPRDTPSRGQSGAPQAPRR